MSTETEELIRISEQLPQPQRALLTDYARSLLASSPATGCQDNVDCESARLGPQFGFAKGLFEMRDDFDAPLDEFAEYR
jgi:hypothetical protein